MFEHPKNNKLFLIKRVIALGGEKVKIENGKIYIDGKEFYKTWESASSQLDSLSSYSQQNRVPQGLCFRYWR